LSPLDAQLEREPGATQAIDVASALRIRLALSYCRQDRGDDAIPVFQRSIQDMEVLCEGFPWNEYYWGNLTWFHADMETNLHAIGRAKEANAMLRNYRDWLLHVATILPDDSGPQEKLREAKTRLLEILGAVGLEHEADQLHGESQFSVRYTTTERLSLR
jgi:hypothetical protein